jgi:hypothetical protein
MKIWSLALVLVALAAPSFPASAHAIHAVPILSHPTPAPVILGAPMICREFEIGEARSLPWERGQATKSGYDRARLVDDVAAALATETDLVVRMETLRRATMYVGKDAKLAWELVGERSLALLDQTASGSKESTAWFDVAFLVACFRQSGVDLDCRAGVADKIDGYGYFKMGLERARVERNDQIGTIEFAAALAAHPAMMRGGGDEAAQERYRRHLDAARNSAPPGSLLEKNLATHLADWKGHFGL